LLQGSPRYRVFTDALSLGDAKFILLARHGLPMALFKRKTFFLPEIVIAIAINVVAAVLVYYATLLWALYKL
jgi:hypothetical protein